MRISPVVVFYSTEGTVWPCIVWELKKSIDSKRLQQTSLIFQSILAEDKDIKFSASKHYRVTICYLFMRNKDLYGSTPTRYTESVTGKFNTV